MPSSGVGLARLEFIINNNIGVHPKAILDYPNIDADLKKAVESVARGHASPRAFYVDKLVEGIATIAAAFFPRPVIVRLSDFKSNEYRKLIGGTRYEPDEENPMLGFRGASPLHQRRVLRTPSRWSAKRSSACGKDMGLTNVEIMVPFVRTVRAGGAASSTMLAERGLKRAASGGTDGLRIIMMCEVPSNAILAEQFLEHFDGMSIGSNDLTQLTLGLDRDSGLEQLAGDFDERDPAVKALISRAIRACRATGKYIGICGQGPSDHPDFADWLARRGHRVHLAEPGHRNRDLAAPGRPQVSQAAKGACGAGPGSSAGGSGAFCLSMIRPAYARFSLEPRSAGLHAPAEPHLCLFALSFIALCGDCLALARAACGLPKSLDRLHLSCGTTVLVYAVIGILCRTTDPDGVFRRRPPRAGALQRHGRRRRLDERGHLHRPGRHALR